jgi:MSHA pilin protein MshD
MTKPRRSIRRSGVTLIEMIVVILIMGIALSATIQLISQLGTKGSGAMTDVKALDLAQSYLDEIMSRGYDEFTPVGGVPPCGAPSAAGCTLTANYGPETTVSGTSCLRTNSSGSEPTDCESNKTVYDDVDDFDGLDEGTGSAGDQDLTNSSGDVRAGYENFRVQVAVDQPSGLGEVKRIVLTVTQPTGEELKFTSYKANF